MRGTVHRLDVPLNGAHEFGILRAWHDYERTSYQLRPTGEAEDVPAVDPTLPIETVELPLAGVKLWLAPDGQGEFAALIFEDGPRAQVRLLALNPEMPVETFDALPLTREPGSRLTVFLLANPSGCFVQIRRGRREATRYANFDLSGAGVFRSEGDLGFEPIE